MGSQPNPDDLWQKLVMPEEDKRLYPAAPSRDGGYRWFRSANIVDLQHYRSPSEKERIRMVLLRGPGRQATTIADHFPQQIRAKSLPL
jgi:hypothetical protein